MQIIFRILAIVLRHKWRLAISYVALASASLSYLYLPRLFGRAIDQVDEALQVGTLSAGAITTTVMLILGISVIRGIFAYFQQYLGEALSQDVSQDIRNAFYDKVQHLSFGFHDRYHTGNLMSRAITDVENIRMFINMGVMRTPYFFILFIVVAVLLLRMDWQLGLISLGFMPIVMLQSAIVRLHMRRLWLLVQEMMAELNTVLQENLTGIRVVKSFASEDYEERKFNKHSRDVAETTVKAERIRAANTAFMSFTFMVALGLILWFGGGRVIDGRLTPGELAQFIFYMQILSMPVRMIGWMVNSYARATSAGQRLFEILDYESPVEDSTDALPMARARGHVRFENVSFAYEGGGNVLTNISLDVPPGKVIALLGAPGSGKSSIVNMIPRFYDPTEGRVTVDGVDVQDVSLASLRRNVGMVQQDVFLFADSIRDNIAYGREDADMDLIVQAAKVAQLHEFIESQHDGYEAAVGERGTTLSGGQRQRLAIARAVLLDPPVLILDDSTSSVDTRTEERIRQAMESVMRNRTTFVIAHRLSTVHRADQIVVLQNGRIVEQGTHRELLALDGLYKEIYDLQLRPQEEVMLEVDVSAPGPGRFAAT